MIISGFYRGVAPGLTGSLATGATYFGVIESTKKWIEEAHPKFGGHWAHFIAGGVGECFVLRYPWDFLVGKMVFVIIKAPFHSED